MPDSTLIAQQASKEAGREIDESIAICVGGGSEAREVARIGRHSGYSPSFNLPALLLGSLWYAARGLWGGFLLLLMAETVALFILGFGLLGDFGAEQARKAHSLESTIAARETNLATAISEGSSSIEMLRRNVDELHKARRAALQAAEEAGKARPWYVALGVGALIALRLIAALLANPSLLHGYERWRSDRAVAHGFSLYRIAAGAVILTAILSVLYVHLTHPALTSSVFEQWNVKQLRSVIAAGIDEGFKLLAIHGEAVFDALKTGITSLLALFEAVLVASPVAITYVFIVLIAWRMAGPRVAILTATALAYILLFGFWDKAMMTAALLGTAALICIVIGIPVGIWCGRNNRVFSIVRPILDFMQTMPSFVYLIPVIAFFGTGKTPAIIATMVFGMPPVIRLTTLGIRGVPVSVREAAISFGASPRFMLWKVDLPMAAPSIMAGVNQTILLCLSMVVVASLIGAKGLGEDVLIALQYAAAGDGVLAGLAILCCAIVFDRVVQGRKAQ